MKKNNKTLIVMNVTLGDFYKSPRRGETINNTVQAEGAVP